MAYPVATQRLHKRQGQREKLVNQLHEERRKDLFKRLDETVRLEVLAQDEFDQALAWQRNNTTPHLLEVPDLSQEDLAILGDTEKQDYLGAVDAAKGFKTNLGAAAARDGMHRDKIQAAQASKRDEPQQKEAQTASEAVWCTPWKLAALTKQAKRPRRIAQRRHTYSRPRAAWKKQ